MAQRRSFRRDSRTWLRKGGDRSDDSDRGYRIDDSQDLGTNAVAILERQRPHRVVIIGVVRRKEPPLDLSVQAVPQLHVLQSVCDAAPGGRRDYRTADGGGVPDSSRKRRYMVLAANRRLIGTRDESISCTARGLLAKLR